MNTSDQLVFNSAVSLAQSGYCDAAYSVLNSLVNTYPEDPNLLFWLALTASDKDIAYSATQTLGRITPKSPALAAIRVFLELQDVKQTQIDSENIPQPESLDYPDSNTKYRKEEDNKSHSNDKAITPTQSPEREELEQKKQELARLAAELIQKELDLTTTQSELQEFEQKYIRIVVAKYAKLDEIEARIAEANAVLYPGRPEVEQQAQEARTQAKESSKVADEANTQWELKNQKQASVPPPEDLKKLYRQVAKLVHPDLATNEEERVRRNQLMAEVNQAYKDGNEAKLKALLDKWKYSPELVKGGGVEAELLRTIRKIAQVRERLHQIQIEINQLKESELFELKIQVEAADTKGKDLLGEMSSHIDRDIKKAESHLAEVKKDLEK